MATDMILAAPEKTCKLFSFYPTRHLSEAWMNEMVVQHLAGTAKILKKPPAGALA
jgi:hypothetical protein